MEAVGVGMDPSGMAWKTVAQAAYWPGLLKGRKVYTVLSNIVTP
jgi:hypothetical protein